MRGRGNTVATVKIPGVEMLTIFASFASNTFWLIIYKQLANVETCNSMPRQC